MRHIVELYKTFVRPMQRTSRIYHHTPVVRDTTHTAGACWNWQRKDRSRAAAALFRLSDPAEPEYLLRFRGLDVARRYQVTFDNTGESCVLDGFTLSKAGIPIALETALTSELLLAEAVS